MKKEKDEIEIPKEWESDQEPIEKKKRFRLWKGPRKFRLRGLRFLNRGIAVILLIFNFCISQITLAAGPMEAKLMAFVFLGNAYIAARYLWTSRRVTS